MSHSAQNYNPILIKKLHFDFCSIVFFFTNPTISLDATIICQTNQLDSVVNVIFVGISFY